MDSLKKCLGFPASIKTQYKTPAMQANPFYGALL